MRRILRAWYMYDWANSAYPLVVSTALFPIYFSLVARDRPLGTTVTFTGTVWENATLYSLALALSYGINALLVPVLSGIADWSGRKKVFLQLFCTLGAAACATLALMDRSTLELGLVAVVLASVGFNGSLVFYNAFLPEIAPTHLHDRVSAMGYMMGYLGSSLLLIAILLLIANPHWVSIHASKEQVFLVLAPWSFVAVGLWWRGFAEVTFRAMPERPSKQPMSLGSSVRLGINQLRQAVRIAIHDAPVGLFLLCYCAASMGVQSVILLASLFGKQELRLEESTLVATILMVQFVALLGSWLCAHLTERLGNTRALLLITLVWMGACASAFTVQTAFGFAMLSAVVGIVLGGIQSQMRSTFAKLATHHAQHASLFSLYDIAEKLGTMAGMTALGAVVGWTRSLRIGAVVLSLAFVLAAGLLLVVHRLAGRDSRYSIITQPQHGR